MTEQLYRVCWRTYYTSGPDVRDLTMATPLTIGETYLIIAQLKKWDAEFAVNSDLWLIPA